MSILHKKHHKELLAHLPQTLRRANIPEVYVHTPMSRVCQPAEIEFIRKYRTNTKRGIFGLVFVQQKNVHARMCAMIGAFLRNYIDARLFGLESIIAAMEDKENPSGTVVCIPDFVLKGITTSHADWRLLKVSAWLQERYSRELQTIIAIDSPADVRTFYGDVVADIVKTYVVAE